MGYREAAEYFVGHEKPFHLGFLPTEQSHPVTRHLDRDFAESALHGVRCLQKVDRDVLKMAYRVFRSPGFAALAEAGYAAVSGGHRIVFSGCGATGRLSLLLEAMWRTGCSGGAARKWRDSVAGIMTGGDFALVKSVEAFEDFSAFGARQLADMDFAPDDLLVAITEGGETSSVLGTVQEATRIGGRAFLLFNNPAELLKERLERSREAIENPRVTVLDLFCGPMAIAGSTRMQATTAEQLIASAALELIICRLLGGGETSPDFASAFGRLLDGLEAQHSVRGLADYIDFEYGIYRGGGRVTYFADDYLLDIFTDTTERSPTFMLPGFRKIGDSASPEPWAFVRNPLYGTSEAMRRALGDRELRCLNWTSADYRQMNAPERLVAEPPEISAGELGKIPVGNEPIGGRFDTGHDAAVLFGWGAIPGKLAAGCRAEAQKARYCRELTIGTASGSIPFSVEPTRLKIFEHLGIKLALNTISTGTMVKLGRVCGNWMSFVAVSNKKLIDRAIRLVAELGNLDYRHAAVELFRAIEESNELPPGRERPPAVQMVLKRLNPARFGGGGENL